MPVSQSRSWTVSYDPKAEAWISFHDWHPELCMSSINHFLTIKTGTTDIPQCPPGFVYDADLEKCVRLIDVTEDAVVSQSRSGGASVRSLTRTQTQRYRREAIPIVC